MPALLAALIILLVVLLVAFAGVVVRDRRSRESREREQALARQSAQRAIQLALKEITGPWSSRRS